MQKYRSKEEFESVSYSIWKKAVNRRNLWNDLIGILHDKCQTTIFGPKGCSRMVKKIQVFVGLVRMVPTRWK
jgi:hypothetical protein